MTVMIGSVTSALRMLHLEQLSEEELSSGLYLFTGESTRLETRVPSPNDELQWEYGLDSKGEQAVIDRLLALLKSASAEGRVLWLGRALSPYEKINEFFVGLGLKEMDLSDFDLSWQWQPLSYPELEKLLAKSETDVDLLWRNPPR